MQKDSVFIVRPFGDNRPVVKKKADEQLEIEFFNFDRVEKDLILPALKQLNLDGGTTQRIFASGEIREDMFSQLLLADIVIADITIHNANVFYELGIRHALRCKTTILIKCTGYDETPFDVIGYKYISYKKDEPGKALDELVAFIKNGASDDRKDSPVFNMLPKLKEPDTEKLLAVPESFIKEVKESAAAKRVPKLLLLAGEAAFFSWHIPALRIVGDRLYTLEPSTAGQSIWEKILEEYPGDYQANDRLATIYQRMADDEMTRNPEEAMVLFEKSDNAIETLLINNNADDKKRAEAAALKGRNAKARWLNSWKNAADRPIAALESSYLEIAYQNYEAGFYTNLNHYYSGINALALITIIVELANQYPEDWAYAFDTDKEAAEELEAKQAKRQELIIAMGLALEAERRELRLKNETNIWFNITEADFFCLTSDSPKRVAAKYRKALQTASDFEKVSVLRQIDIYKTLNILPENVQAAINIMAPASTPVETKMNYILFTGHMIDRPDRKEPRFPPDKETAVRAKIKDELTIIKGKFTGPVLGIAGGACGGDILFHEVCSELGIPTELYLALRPDKFKRKSVNYAGNSWAKRFDSLCNSQKCHKLSDTEVLPVWLQKKENYTIWERNNLWMLNSALINGSMHMALLALWDGREGDGPGGTQHMINESESRGAAVTIIDI